MKRNKRNLKLILSLALLLAQSAQLVLSTEAQTVLIPDKTASSASSKIYLDAQNGMTADEAVARALEHNGEILALRKEVDAANSLVKQAALRPNPKIEASGARAIAGSDNNQMLQGSLPLELGGRRAARIKVARAELEIRELNLANQERLLASEVRSKFGETLASIKKLELLEKSIDLTKQGYDLIAAKVIEGRTAPLEQNMFLVELNRLRSLRETAEGKTEIAMFELKNLIGMKPEEPLRLRGGDFQNLLINLPPMDAATEQALNSRPDLRGARAVENLAVARIEQTRAEGKVDASLTAGYQRMDSSFPVRGFDEAGTLRPVQSIFNFFTFGIEIDLPVRNRNQGAVGAAIFEREAALRRVEFGELTVQRETSSAYARYNRAARALTIFQNGVRDQASANLGVIWQTYELGKRNLSDYIAEERRYLEIEDALIDAELETYLARVEFLRATNVPELLRK